MAASAHIKASGYVACSYVFFSVTTEAVPVHVDTSPPLSPAAEIIVIIALNTANEIVDRLKDTCSAVKDLMLQLKDDLISYRRTVVQDQLKKEFEKALYQGGVPPAMVPWLALGYAHNTVKDIQMVVAKRGDSIVVYFLCKTVKSIYALGQMIMSGFMHAVFAAVIESMSRTTVDVIVYVRADEVDFHRLCLSSPQDKSWSIAV